jgi:hypothetical protein
MTIVRVSDRGGFDWADAGIGAVGGFALSVLGASLALLVSERRAGQWRYPAAAKNSVKEEGQ